MLLNPDLENPLGWKIVPAIIPQKALLQKEDRQIGEFENGKTKYILGENFILDADEEKFLGQMLETYRVSGTAEKLSAEDFFKVYIAKKKSGFDDQKKQKLLSILKRSVSREGMICIFLEDPDLEEIAVIGSGKESPVFVFDKNFGWLETNFYFANPQEVRNFVNSVASESGKRLTFQSPKINAPMRDKSRLNACAEPISKNGAVVTIRKFARQQISACTLAQWGCVSFEQLAFLWMALQADCSVLICGNTGSGKTTLLSSLLNFIPQKERIVLVEDTPEIQSSHRHLVRLCTAEGIDIGFCDLIVNTLRMRPDRVIVGEVRSRNEIHALMDALLAGQGKGCYATFHAESANDAISRLASHGVALQDIGAIDLIITQKRWTCFENGRFCERRKIIEICEPEFSQSTATARKLYSFDFAKKKFVKNSESKRICEKIMRTFGLGQASLAKEISARANFLELNSGYDTEAVFGAIQGYGKNV